MPNLLDCPREIRDPCYKAYFESTLQEGHVDKFPITWSSHSVALETVETSISVLTALLAATESELEMATVAVRKAIKAKYIAHPSATFVFYQDVHREYLRCSRYREEVRRRRGKQSVVAYRLRRRLRWLKSPQGQNV